MLSVIEKVNDVVNNFIWGVPAMICIIGVGLLLSFRTGFIQIRKFPYAMKVTLGRMLKREASDGALHTVSGSVYGTCGDGRYRKCGRSCGSHSDRWTGSGVLDVDFSTSGHVHQVLGGHTCCTFSREKCKRRPGRRPYVLY